jgi:hypothetical protein
MPGIGMMLSPRDRTQARATHDEREAGLFDHSIIVIDLKLPGPSNVRIQTA